MNSFFRASYESIFARPVLMSSWTWFLHQSFVSPKGYIAVIETLSSSRIFAATKYHSISQNMFWSSVAQWLLLKDFGSKTFTFYRTSNTKVLLRKAGFRITISASISYWLLPNFSTTWFRSLSKTTNLCLMELVNLLRKFCSIVTPPRCCSTNRTMILLFHKKEFPIKFSRCSTWSFSDSPPLVVSSVRGSNTTYPGDKSYT